MSPVALHQKIISWQDFHLNQAPLYRDATRIPVDQIILVPDLPEKVLADFRGLHTGMTDSEINTYFVFVEPIADEVTLRKSTLFSVNGGAAIEEESARRTPEQVTVGYRYTIFSETDFEVDLNDWRVLRSTKLVRAVVPDQGVIHVELPEGKRGFLGAGRALCQSVENPQRIWIQRLFAKKYGPA